jgi:D-glycero-D-manno-heptose 1,7-bisphosphate phosphatase
MAFYEANSSPPTLKHKALFLDRDGVLIEYIPYLSHPDQVKIPEAAGITLKTWQDAGYLLIVITNQSGVGRGYFTMDDVAAVHKRMREEYKPFGVQFQEIIVCPHQPSTNCRCRKPSPYAVIEASKKYSIDTARSFFIGDAPSDIECAIRSGCHPVLLLTGRGMSTATTLLNSRNLIPIFNDLAETVQLIKTSYKHKKHV